MDYNFDNERPIYIQIVEKLKIGILTGYYELGSRFPSVRDLALTIKVNPNTIQKALTELEEEKLIYTERTNGKFVTDNKELIDQLRKELAKSIVSKYLNDMNNIGISFQESVNYLQELGGKK